MVVIVNFDVLQSRLRTSDQDFALIVGAGGERERSHASRLPDGVASLFC